MLSRVKNYTESTAIAFYYIARVRAERFRRRCDQYTVVALLDIVKIRERFFKPHCHSQKSSLTFCVSDNLASVITSNKINL